MKGRAIFFVTLAMLAGFTMAKAATYSFEPVADARVIDFSGYEHLNFASDILSCYTAISENNTQRTFIYFDLSSIALAPTQIVQSATLTLTASTLFGNNPNSMPMEIHRVLAPWTETGLTWSNRDITHTWVTSGGDFIGSGGQPYAVSTVFPTNGQAVTWNVTALVQEWVSHTTTNYGLMLKSADGNRLTFSSRESPTAALRPNLTVVVNVGLPPLHTYSSGGQVVLWWTGANSILQEKTNLNPVVPWADSGRLVTPLSGSNLVTISGPKGNNFFRLRGGP